MKMEKKTVCVITVLVCAVMMMGAMIGFWMWCMCQKYEWARVLTLCGMLSGVLAIVLWAVAVVCRDNT